MKRYSKHWASFLALICVASLEMAHGLFQEFCSVACLASGDNITSRDEPLKSNFREPHSGLLLALPLLKGQGVTEPRAYTHTDLVLTFS